MGSVNESMSDVASVADLVEIAPQSTVSRTILRQEGVRLVLFAFDKGEELSEHTVARRIASCTRMGASGWPGPTS